MLLGREAGLSLRYTSMLLGREAGPSMRYTSMLLGRQATDNNTSLSIGKDEFQISYPLHDGHHLRCYCGYFWFGIFFKHGRRSVIFDRRGEGKREIMKEKRHCSLSRGHCLKIAKEGRVGGGRGEREGGRE